MENIDAEKLFFGHQVWWLDYIQIDHDQVRKSAWLHL